MGKRVEQYDVIRAVAMCFAIGVHVMVFVIPFKAEYGITWYVSEVLVLIFFTCNGLFFMLSGKFVLGNEKLLAKGYKRYYIDKAIKILVPLILYSLLVYYIKNQSVLGYFKAIYEGDINKSYWFIYTLMGLYLVAPFLYKMISAMKKNDLRILILVIFVFQIITVYSVIFSKGFGINSASFGFTNWISYFILGYAIEILCDTNKKRNIIMLLGIISIVVSIIEVRFFPEYSIGIHDLSITMVLITCLFFFLIRDFLKLNTGIKKALSYISRYFLSIYLLHSLILRILSKYIVINQTGIDMALKLSLIFLLTLIISFVLAFVIDGLIVRPIQKVLLRIIAKFIAG